MSRLARGFDGIPLPVTVDAEGVPVRLSETPILHVLSHYREWIGVLEVAPQRDVYFVQTARGGLCELHHLTYPTQDEELGKEAVTGTWLLVRWED